MADANQGNVPVVPANQAIINQLAALNAQLQQLQQENATLANDIQVLQQANQGGGALAGQANQANQGGGAPGGQANAPGVPAAPTFALTPATTNLTGLIDYSSKLGQSIYKQGCAKLTDDDGFPMTPATTVSFVKAFENRCNIMGWNAGAQNVTKFTNQSNVVIDIVKNYGQIAEDDLKIGCEAFCKAGGARFQSRASQNNHMMAQCLFNSLTSDAKTRLEVFQTQFTYDEIAYGPLIYKKIMQLATIDSVATTETLRTNLTNLPSYAASVNGDIDLINAYFDQNYTQILARGSTVDDPIAKLFDAYLVVPDYTFKTYMAKKQDSYHDGDLGPSFTHEKLMAQATAKFTYLTTRKLWGSKSPDEEKLIAMIADLKGKLKLGPALEDKRKPGGGKKNDGKSGGSKTKNKKNTGLKTHQKKDEAWKKLPPKDGDPTTKEIAGKKCQWCVHHMAWGIHSAAECRLGASRKNSEGKDNKTNKENKPKDKALSYAAAAATVAGGPGFAAFLSELSDDEE